MYANLKPVRMKAIREERGMSRQALSACSNVSPAIIGKTEAGRYIPYDPELDRLAAALGVDDPAMLLEPLEVI